MPRQPCSRWANRLDVDEVASGAKAAVRSPPRPLQRPPGYGTSTSAVDYAMSVRLVHSKYRHPAVYCRLLWTGTVRSIPYGQSRPTRAVYRISLQGSSTCSIAPLRTRPAQNLVELVFIGAGRLNIVCLQPQPSPDPPRPRSSNRCQVPRPVLSTPVRALVGLWVQDSTTHTHTQISAAQ